MTGLSRRCVRRWLPALSLSLAIVLTAPVIGEIRSLLFTLFPDAVIGWLAGGFVLLLGGALGLAVWRIRHHRLLRYAGLGLVVVALWLQVMGFKRHDPRVDVVERIHIVEYGLLAMLLMRALRPAGSSGASGRSTGLRSEAAVASDALDRPDDGGWAGAPLGLGAMVVFSLLGVTFVGVLDEGVQWWSPLRVSEFRDVLLNVSAGATGVLFSLCLSPPSGLRGWWGPRGTLRRVAACAAVVVAAGGLLFDLAHLGHEVVDPEIGRFRSWFTAEQLDALSRDRASAWRIRPMAGREMWGPQDYYLTEAVAHTQHRNERFRAGSLVMAWRANQILERYYGPFLDKPNLDTGEDHRMDDHVLRRMAAAARGDNPAGYRSPVHTDRIVVWPKGRYRGVLVAGVALLLLIAGWGRGPIRQP